MAELIALVQTYIGPLVTPKHLNYYSALGLDELTEDRQAIALAVENAIEKLKRSDRTKDPKGFEEVVKVVRSARSTLLDSDKKATYDAQLKSLLRKIAPEVLGEDSQLLTESARLKELLPNGDPSAPFSLTDFLKSRPEDIPYETVAQRQEALRPLLASNGMHSVSTATNRIAPTLNQPAGLTHNNHQGLAPNMGRPVASPARALQEELRRKRKQSNLIAGGIAVGAACIFLSVGLWMFLTNRSEQLAIAAKQAANQNANQNANPIPDLPNSESPQPTNATTEVAKSNSPSPKKRMNLGIKKDSDSADKSATTPMRLPGIGESLPDNASSETMPDKSNEATSPNNVPETPVKETGDMPKPDMQMGMGKNGGVSEGMKPDAAMPDEKNQAAWSLAMKQAMEAVRSRQFETFGAEIDKALAAAEDPKKEKESERLNLVGQLVQMSDKAFEDGYKSLRSTNTIAFTETDKAIIVEVTPELLVARVKGNNERMPVDKLSIEWVLAIANLELGNQAIDDAVRGSIMQWDPRATAESRKTAKKFFDKAAAKDTKFSMLESVYTSDYK